MKVYQLLTTEFSEQKTNDCVVNHLRVLSYRSAQIVYDFLPAGGYPPPLQHTLSFCQFVESDPKGLGLKYFAGWMLFGRVIKILKIEKMRFSSYFDACDESSSYLASRSYEALQKKMVHEKLFVGFNSTG